MFTYRAVCTDPRTGTNHKAKLWGLPTQIQFDDRPPVQPFDATIPLLDLWIAAFEDRLLGITVDGRDRPQGGGKVYLIGPTGIVQPICDGVGLNGAKIRYTDAGQLEIYSMVFGEAGWISVFNAQGVRLRRFPAPYSSTGIFDITGDNSVRMTTDPSIHQVIDGVPLAHVRTSEGYALGGGDVGNHEPAIILVNTMASPTLKREYLINSQVPWQLAVGQQGVWAAISGHDTPEPDAVPWQPYRPLVTVPTPPDVPPVVTPPADPCESVKAGLAESKAEQARLEVALRNATDDHMEARDKIDNLELLAYVDPSADQPVTWRARAESAERKLNKLPSWLRRML